MNVVWPITGLYAGPLALALYFALGRQNHDAMMRHAAEDGGHHDMPKHPLWQSAILGTTHCGAGCTLGDVVAEFGVFAAGIVWFGSRLFTAYTVEFIAAFLLGVAFQYFAIVPMRKLSPGKGILEALKADTLSLIAFQVGMYAWMALTQKVFFAADPLEPNDPRFWFMMQIAMLAGFSTSYPANILLIRLKIKERM